MPRKHNCSYHLLKATLTFTLCAAVCLSANGQKRGKTITTAEQDKITASAKQTLHDLMKLLDYISDTTRDQSERDYAINEAFNGQEYLFTKSAKIETDADPTTHTSSASTVRDANDYLKDLNFYFKKEDTAAFASFDITCVKLAKDGRKYIQVPFTELFSGTNGKGTRFTKNTRVADMTVIPLDKHEWKTIITSISFYDPAKITSQDCMEKGEADTDTTDVADKPEAYYAYMFQKGDRVMGGSKFTEAYFCFMEAKKNQNYTDAAKLKIIDLADRMRGSGIQGVHEYWSNQLTIKGKELESEHRYEQALQYYNYALEINGTSNALPKLIEVMKDKLALKKQLAANFDKKLYDQGVAEYTSAIKNDIENSDLYLERAKCYWMLGNDLQARLDFNYAIKLNTTIDVSNVLVYLWKGKYFESKNNATYYDSAYACFVNYVNKSDDKDDPGLVPIYAEAAYCKAMNLYKKNNYHEAIDSFNAAITRNNNYKEAYCYLGYCYFETKDNEKAEENFKKAMAIDGNYADAHFGYGKTLRQKDWSKYAKEAISEMGTAIVLNDKSPNWPSWNAELADIMQRMADYDAAIKYYNNSIKSNPDKYAPYYLSTGECYHQLRQNDAARQEYAKYKSWCEKNPNIVPDKRYQADINELESK